jgi:hypothetical protein
MKIVDQNGNTIKEETIFFSGYFSLERIPFVLNNGNIFLLFRKYRSVGGNSGVSTTDYIIFDQNGDIVKDVTTLCPYYIAYKDICQCRNGNILIAYQNSVQFSKGSIIILDEHGEKIQEEIGFTPTSIKTIKILELENHNIFTVYAHNSGGTAGIQLLTPKQLKIDLNKHIVKNYIQNLPLETELISTGNTSYIYNGAILEKIWQGKVVNGFVRNTSSTVVAMPVTLGFKPDLIIAYASANSAQDITIVTTTTAYFDDIPKIITQTQTSGDYITEDGFIIRVNSTGVNYIAIKF